MQPAKCRARAGQKNAEDHPQNEERMQNEDENRKLRVDTRSCMHS